jgi:hypothetical protein
MGEKGVFISSPEETGVQSFIHSFTASHGNSLRLGPCVLLRARRWDCDYDLILDDAVEPKESSFTSCSLTSFQHATAIQGMVSACIILAGPL